MKRFYLLSVICFLSTGIFAQENTGEERTLSADSIITSDARLDSIYQSLPEVMITGERPIFTSPVVIGCTEPSAKVCMASLSVVL